MNNYLMAVTGFFTGDVQFVINAENKADAVKKGLEYVRSNPKYGGGNFKRNSVRVVKKLRK